MTTRVGIREFRESLADYIAAGEPVEVTRHGAIVAIFTPVKHDLTEVLARYRASAAQVSALLDEAGLTEEDIAAEFEQLRREARRS